MMFFVIWSKRVGGRADTPLADYWQVFENYGDAARLYAALVDDAATYTATITGDVIESTDYAKTKGERHDR